MQFMEKHELQIAESLDLTVEQVAFWECAKLTVEDSGIAANYNYVTYPS